MQVEGGGDSPLSINYDCGREIPASSVVDVSISNSTFLNSEIDILVMLYYSPALFPYEPSGNLRASSPVIGIIITSIDTSSLSGTINLSFQLDTPVSPIPL